ncbi:MAG: ribosome maturation factor RimM [Bacillota bacterium]
MSKYITIGKIVSNQGNKGEVRVIPLTDFPGRFEDLVEITVRRDGKCQKLEVESVRYHKNFVVLKFCGVDDIGEALAFKNSFLQIPEQDLVPLTEDDYYIYRIIGYSVYTVDDVLLGTLKDVIETGGVDIFLVEGEDKEYMIPGSKEIITSIEPEEESIFVKPIPGLLEL